jgi:hypothetical protein
MNRSRKKGGAEPGKLDAEKTHSLFERTLCQPPGEDFFLAEVQLDTPSDPCWDEGFTVFGSWETIERTISNYRAFGPRGQLRIFQGEAARRRLVKCLLEERRYQEQRRSTPNN